MELKPGYQMTEVGVIPDDWDVFTIGETVTLINGRAFKPSDWTTYGLPIIRIQNLNDPMAAYNYYDGVVEDRYYVKKGDILFAWSGTKESSFGARMWRGETAILNQHIFRVVPDKGKLLSEYVLLALKRFQEDIERKSHGFKSSFVHIRKSDLEKTYLAIPPLPEQSSITTALSDINALLVGLDQIITKKRDLKQATIQQLLTGKKRLPGFGEGKGYQQTEIGIIPEDWEIDRVASLASIKTGSRNTQDRINDGQYPFFVRSQTVERINTYSFDGEAVLTAGDGVGTGKVFHYINGKFDVHQRVYRISNFKLELDGFFFYKYFSNRFYDRIMSMTAKSSVDSVRMEMIADMLVPLPDPAEQRAIATVLSDMDAEIAALEQRRDKTRALKQGMMQELLTGRTRLV